MTDHLELLDDLAVPESLEEAAYKAELFMIRGMQHRALQFWEEVRSHPKPDDMDLSEYLEELHFRVCRMAYHRASFKLVDCILDDVPEEAHEHPAYRIFRHLLWHNLQAERGMCFFPLNVWYEDVDDGPHLDAGTYDMWAAGRVDAVDGASIEARMVEYDSSGQRVKAGIVSIPAEVFPLWKSDKDHREIEEGDFFELYGMQDEEYPTLRWWGRSWDGWKDLPPLRTDPLRYLRRSGWIEGGDTFMEKAVRGEVGLSDIDQAVEEWHQGTNPKTKAWTLADHLGLLPPEYRAWVEQGNAYLETLVQERRILWDKNRDELEEEPILYL